MTQYADLKGVPLDAYNKCCNEILRRAQEQMGLPREEIILRDLRSDDLGVTGKWKFSVTTTAGWNNLVCTYSISDNRFICISGIFTEMTVPNVHSIRITRAGSVARWWNVQRIALQDDNEMHIDDPIIVDQNQTITIEGYNGMTTTTTTEEIGFIGCVAEKRGLVINP
jgi:hypothetical protein